MPCDFYIVTLVETPSRERLCSRCVCSFTIALEARFRSFVHWLSSLLRLAAAAIRRRRTAAAANAAYFDGG